MRELAWIKSWLSRFNWGSFWHLVEQEIRVFLFLLFLLMVYRTLFLVFMSDYMGSGVMFSDIMTAQYYGWKLSLKSAGVLTLGSVCGSLLLYFIQPRWQDGWRKWYGGSVIFGLTFLFFARIPYYQQFLSGFNQLIFNTFYDDVGALLWTIHKEYHLEVRLLGIVIAVAAIYWLYKSWLNWQWSFYVEPKGIFRYLVRCLWLAGLYVAIVFVSFGGSLSYVGNVDWENSGVTKDRLLNEAILDDVQALYRAWELNSRLESSTGLLYTADDVREYAAYLSGRSADSHHLADYLAKTAEGKGHSYQHIFLILSESYANWPLLDKYANLHIADGMRSLIGQPDSAYTAAFLPNGMSTISAVMGTVTGLADANLYLTTMPEAYAAPYITSIAPQLGRLGYQTDFWYAGPSSWERIRDFTLAQGFDHFYGRGDYPFAGGNVWGCDDEYLYQAVLDRLDNNKKTFHLILNVANHSPYTVDLVRAGFPFARVREALPETAQKDETLLRQLGHYWYADRQLAAFIDAAQSVCPNSLFIVVGDHADRMNIEKTPSLYERYGIPLILHGAGISQATLPKEAAGSQIELVPTIMELTAPQGFVYYSIGRSLTRGNVIGVNYGFWLTSQYIGQTDTEPLQGEAFGAAADGFASEAICKQINAVRALSWYIGKHGLILEK